MVKIKFNSGTYEVYWNGTYMRSFQLERDAKLYAEVLKRNADLNVAKGVIASRVEEYFGACEVLSFHIDFPYLHVHLLTKGVELKETVPIEEGMMGSTVRVANAVLKILSRKLGCSFPPVSAEDVKQEAVKQSVFRLKGKEGLLFEKQGVK